MNDRPEQPTGQPPPPVQSSSVDWLKVVGLIVSVAVSFFWIGYRVGQSATPPQQMLLQWGGPDGCGYGYTRVPMSNWPGPGDEPVLCRHVAD